MKAFFTRVARTFELSLAVMLIYRANILFFLVFETMFMVSQFLGVSLGFDLAGDTIVGWTREQAMLLTAINSLSHQAFVCLFINSIFNVAVYVWNGFFDYLLLKPLHPLESMWVNGQVVVSNVPSLILSVGLLIYFLLRNAAAISWASIPAFILMIFLGIMVRAALALLCVAPVFYAEKFAETNEGFWSLTSLSRYPMGIYPRLFEMFLTFALPLGMLAFVPASFLFGHHPLSYYLIAIACSLGFIALCITAFMRAMRSYQSVNAGVV